MTLTTNTEEMIPRIPPLHILVIDDNEDQRESLTTLLSLHKMTAEGAGSLAWGLAMIAKGGIDLVIVDLELPDATRITSIDQIHTAYPEIPIIALTGHKELLLRALIAGAQEAVAKPPGADEIVMKIYQAYYRTATERKFRPYTDATERIGEKIDRQIAKAEAASEKTPPPK